MSGAPPRGPAASVDGRRIPGAMTALGVLLALEAVGLLAASVLVAVGLATAGSRSMTSGVATAVTGVVLAALLGAVAASTFRGARWIRSAGIVWQLIQLLVGLYAFQGEGARPDLGSLLVVPAVAGLVLLFSKPVVRRTAR